MVGNVARICDCLCIQKKVKGNATVDQLVDNAIEDYEPLNFKLPNKDVIEVNEVEA